MRTLWLFLLFLYAARPASAEKAVVGSKVFTESYVLGEIARKAIENAGVPCEHKQGMGGTIILWEALKQGTITAYPDYTGTIREEILKLKKETTVDELRTELARQGIGMTRELGFNNTYALVMNRKKAEALGIHKISDLRNHPELRLGLNHEFLKRQDGWEPLAKRYNLQMRDVSGIDHMLGYTALANGSIDLKEAYSTDAKIAENDLVVLQDDLNFFPAYKAVFLYRMDADPRVVEALKKLEGSINENLMMQLNAKAEQTKDYSLAAAMYFGEKSAHLGQGDQSRRMLVKIAHWTGRHLLLVGISLFFAIIIGIPLGIWASKPGLASQIIIGTSGLVQTVPALALLALLIPIPFLGVSITTAIVALFFYSLLPIVRNTAAGLQSIPTPLRESAAALGLEPGAQLRKIFLPMASRTILAGVKTSAIINVGSATLAALIGAGGLGEPIISGLNLNDHATILEGAIPAAILALFVQFFFDFLDRFLIPKGLRISSPNS
ncbi:glycine betaine ABC transporter substrate-binding protein [Pedosphaera parvula]|uniref:Substrate-binding region of ABC-type glycine betaine transport system n=1 Tax=Pedosphaera parvula (strain Ellin514) TaxID=320771 RepID=B9XK64_PEDPL|nr:glycine betaine ABC transporter substrate-binding protein [Pedosphaera parvula]EEF59702.1 Substrate-binding region of ABC-type glycine betaine transport system [Pedosphaera parvula Ellin514]